MEVEVDETDSMLPRYPLDEADEEVSSSCISRTDTAAVSTEILPLALRCEIFRTFLLFFFNLAAMDFNVICILQVKLEILF